MRNFAKTTAFLALMLFAGTSGATAAQIEFGIRIGPPPAERVVRVVPRSPGVGYVWIGGYWYPDGARYRWHDGYWTRPPYEGAYWVAPYHSGGQYFTGRWEGSRGNVNHNHSWDRGKQRDENRNPRENNQGRGRGQQ